MLTSRSASQGHERANLRYLGVRRRGSEMAGLITQGFQVSGHARVAQTVPNSVPGDRRTSKADFQESTLNYSMGFL